MEAKKRKTTQTGAVKRTTGKTTSRTTGKATKYATGKEAVKKKKVVSEKTERMDKTESLETKSSRRDAERIRRREARKRKVRRQKIAMATSGVVIVAAAATLVVLFMPSMRLSREMSKAEKYTKEQDYVSAQQAYESALEIDVKQVKAYRNIAENDMAQNKVEEAKQILFEGWENTQDESLLNYYCTVILNEAVAEINDKNVTLDTVDKCVQVIEQNAANADALSLLQTCYDRLFALNEENEKDAHFAIFYDENIEVENCQYDAYEQLLRRMLAVYQANPSEELKNLLVEYALIDDASIRITMTHVNSYITMLSDINQAIANDEITEVSACLTDAMAVQDYFAEAFTQFAAGNFEYARDLIVEDTYQQYRDNFINETAGNWLGHVYIPVNQEQLVLTKEDGVWYYSFLADEDYVNTKGVITIWGTKQEDDGVQRSVISYEAANDGAYPHTEYTVQYLYSNVKINGQYVPQMNYRFDTKVTTEEGNTTVAIGDWGGEHEFEIDY